MDWFHYLSIEERKFLKIFILNAGSIKETSKAYYQSYTKTRKMLDQIIQKMHYFEAEDYDFMEMELQDLHKADDISDTVLRRLLDIHKRYNCS